MRLIRLLFKEWAPSRARYEKKTVLAMFLAFNIARRRAKE